MECRVVDIAERFFTRDAVDRCVHGDSLKHRNLTGGPRPCLVMGPPSVFVATAARG